MEQFPVASQKPRSAVPLQDRHFADDQPHEVRDEGMPRLVIGRASLRPPVAPIPRAGELRLGAEIRRIRQERGMTQADFADAAGITTNYVSLVELGRTNMTLEKAIMITRALAFRLSEVLAAESG